MRNRGPRDLLAALRGTVVDSGWLETAVARVGADPEAIRELFPAVGRHCGRGPLPDAASLGAATADAALSDSIPAASGWTIDDAARTVLLTALPLRGEALAAMVTALYQQGDASEKRGVLRALPRLGLAAELAAPLPRDALRTNDSRLVAAALGPCARGLDAATWRQGVLKCVFMSIPLAVIDALDERADAELARMLTDLAAERRAAGRPFPGDAAALLDRHPPWRKPACGYSTRTST